MFSLASRQYSVSTGTSNLLFQLNKVALKKKPHGLELPGPESWRDGTILPMARSVWLNVHKNELEKSQLV